MKRKILILIFCTLLITLWSYAAISKLISFSIFENQLKLQPIPAWSVQVIHWGLPSVEIVTAILICIQSTRLKGLIVSSALMAVFTFYVSFALTGRFGNIPCSCAGLISAFHWREHLVFNIVLLIISLTCVYFEKYKDKCLPEQHIAI